VTTRTQAAIHASVTIARINSWKVIVLYGFPVRKAWWCNDMSTLYLRLRDARAEIGLLRPTPAAFQDTVASPLIRSEEPGFWCDSSFELEHGLDVAELTSDRLEPLRFGAGQAARRKAAPCTS
jgi:hypothetical protein